MKNCWRVAFAVLLASLVSGCACYGPCRGRCSGSAGGPQSPEKRAFDSAVARVYPALVRINVVTTDPHDGRIQKYQAAGSGAIISREGHIITNHHVAGKARRLLCTLADKEEIEAVLVGTDPLADIAVLKLKLETRKDPKKPLLPAEFGNSDELRVGDTVLAMGSPMALSQSVTKGIVSNTAFIIPGLFWPFTFRLDGEEVGTIVRWIGHDALIVGGNSGGPLVNMKGEIVGINEIGLGLSGAIPGNLARDVAGQIIARGEVKRSWTGLECQPRLKGSSLESGVLVGGVIRGSPAEKAGLAAGDIILSFEGIPVNCSVAEELPVFNRLILSTPVGREVGIVALRDGQKKEFRLTTIGRGLARGKDEEIKSWGITARDLTPLSALELKRSDTVGVFVDTLRPGGPAGEAKPSLECEDMILDVNGKAVKSIAELRAVTREVTKGENDRVPVTVGFERGTRKYLTVVKVGKETPEDKPEQARKAWFPAATQVLTSDLAEALNLKAKTGVRVTQVFPGHSAEKAGVKVGDIILKVDGDAIDASRPEDTEVFPNMIRQRKIGADTPFDIVRDGKPLQLTVRLESPPPAASDLKEYKDLDFEFTVRELSFDDRMSSKIGDDVRGVLVERVEHAGWAALAHVAIGDILLSIDGKPTESVDAVEKLIKEAKAKRAKRLVLFVKRGIHNMYLELEPAWDAEDKEASL